MATIDQHRTALSDLSAQREQLQRDIEQREARVQELEALVEEVREEFWFTHVSVMAVLTHGVCNSGNLGFKVNELS